MKQFINRTSYPIRHDIEKELEQFEDPENSPANLQYDNVIVGAGVSGLYSALRINNSDTTKNQSIAIFDMQKRIAGRLWSI